MSGHTPGPWMVCGTPPNPCWHEGLTIGAASPGDARRVCDVWNWGIENPMTAANANLIAAAPELLHACQLVTQNAPLVSAWLQENDPRAYRQICAAIAKATQP